MKTMTLLLALAASVEDDALAPLPGAWPPMAGRWAFVQVTAAISDTPIVGRVTSETRAVGVLDLAQEGADLQLREQLCDLRTSSATPLVSTRYPAAFVAALSGNERRARLERDAEGGVRFVQPQTWDVKGLRLDDIEGERLPDQVSDPRVVDADGDGAPGLTVRIEGLVSGDVRVVTRGWTALDGRLDSAETPDRVDGTVRWSTEQRVLQVTNSLLSNAPKPQPHPDARRSWFRMVRVPGATTCAEVRSRADRLLGGR